MYYKKILDALPELIYVTKSDGLTAEFFNKTWYKYTGLTEEQAMKGWESVVAPYDVERVSKTVQDAVSKKECYEVELRLRCGDDGSFRWFLAKANPVKDENGNVENYVGMSVDINDTKLSIRDMEAVYERETQKRLEKIAQLEKELEIHKTQN